MESNFRNIRLIVGLGNPGSEYENTRHNAGFGVLNKLLEKPIFSRFEKNNSAESFLYTGRFRGSELILQMPLTYMNDSGRAVGLISRRLNITPEEILVVSDDLDLPLGALRIRNSGSDGGHNGLKSIIAYLNSGNFKRLRIGIGRNEEKVIDYVLSTFSKEEEPIWQDSLSRGSEAVVAILKSGIAHAMNTFNSKSATKTLNSENCLNNSTI